MDSDETEAGRRDGMGAHVAASTKLQARTRGNMLRNARVRWSKVKDFATQFAQIWRTLQRAAPLSVPEEEEDEEEEEDDDDVLTEEEEARARMAAARRGRRSSHRVYVRKLKIGVTSLRPAQSVLGSIRAQQAAAAAATAVSSGAVVTEAESTAGVAFWQQGDTALNTEEAFKQRKALRLDTAVVDELHNFWVAALRSEQQSHTDRVTLHEQGYTLMMRRLYKLLLEDWDEDDAVKAIAEDWVSDTKGSAAGLDRVHFMDSLFELVDVWSHGMDGQAYCAFIRGLFERITLPVVEVDPRTGESRTVSYLWKEERDVTHDPSFASDGGGASETSAPAKRKRKAQERRRAAVTMQKATRRRSARKEASRRSHAVEVIHTGLSRAVQKRRRRTESTRGGMAPLSGSGTQEERSRPSTPGTKGVKQRWALRNSAAFRQEHPDFGAQVAAVTEEQSVSRKYAAVYADSSRVSHGGRGPGGQTTTEDFSRKYSAFSADASAANCGGRSPGSLTTTEDFSRKYSAFSTDASVANCGGRSPGSQTTIEEFRSFRARGRRPSPPRQWVGTDHGSIMGYIECYDPQGRKAPSPTGGNKLARPQSAGTLSTCHSLSVSCTQSSAAKQSPVVACCGLASAGVRSMAGGLSHTICGSPTSRPQSQHRRDRPARGLSVAESKKTPAPALEGFELAHPLRWLEEAELHPHGFHQLPKFEQLQQRRVARPARGTRTPWTEPRALPSLPASQPRTGVSAGGSMPSLFGSGPAPLTASTAVVLPTDSAMRWATLWATPYHR